MIVPMFHEKIVGCMATFPGRFHILRATVESIAPQLDNLLIYVNGNLEGFPDFSDIPNVYVFDGRKYGGDISANGKVYLFSFLEGCRIFTLDDDFIYPFDYVKKNISMLDLFDGRCTVTTHGSIFPPVLEWYFARTHVMAGKSALPNTQLCTLAGSGTFCFDQRFLPIDLADLLSEVMVDLKLSIAAREAGMPIWVLPRQAGWLTPIKIEGLWERFRSAGLTPHTHVARQFEWSFPIYAEITRRSMAVAGVTAADVGLAPELASCIQSGETPTLWRESDVNSMKRADYLRLLLDSEDAA